MELHVSNPSSGEVEEGSLRILGQPGLHSETLGQTNKQKQAQHKNKQRNKKPVSQAPNPLHASHQLHSTASPHGTLES
jgi:hypothetical protein